MGTYTNLKCRIKLRKDTPDDVIALLFRVVSRGDLGLPPGTTFFHTPNVFKPEIAHPFFDCERWYMLLLSTNFDDTKGSAFRRINRDILVLEIDTEFKNYDDEVHHFLDWIKPYTLGRKKRQYIGYFLTEHNPNRRHIHFDLSQRNVLPAPK